MIKLRNLYTAVVSALLMMPLVVSCGIADDLPLPFVKAEIVSLQLEGQCAENGTGEAAALIDKDKRTLDIYVDDQVDLHALKIVQMEVSNGATVSVEGSSISFKPGEGELPTLDFSKDVTLVLSTYQDYTWTVRVHQVIVREVEVENQVGTAIIDEANRNVIVYVSPKQKLSQVSVRKMSLGGLHGSVEPDPAGQVVNFLKKQTFTVGYAFKADTEQWNVFVYNADHEVSTTATVFAHAVTAYVSGDIQNGTVPTVEYRPAGTEQWQVLGADKIKTNTAGYEAEITGLTPATDYECRVEAGGAYSSVQYFTTAPALQLDNSSFDKWSESGSGNRMLYQPWGEGEEPFWDTGNKGATTVGASNVTGVTEGGRTYANLQSKYIVIKFAAGSVFTGTYLKTDGTNGILAFGRPFDSFPTHLQFEYKYKTCEINRGGNKWDEAYDRYMSKQFYESLRGKPDSCHVYIALIGDKDEETMDGKTYPYIIRTRPSELHLLNTNSDNIIAFGQFIKGSDTNEWTTETIQLEYHRKDRKPKYIIVCASSSKYGDYFTGGDQSLLQIDNVKLLYQ